MKIKEKSIKKQVINSNKINKIKKIINRMKMKPSYKTTNLFSIDQHIF